MEAIVAPQGRDHWDKMGMRSALDALRSEAGETMVLQNNYFIEEILPNAILRNPNYGLTSSILPLREMDGLPGL
jgi:haloalkane dehalogenase